jgi:hypothetical protein
MHMAVAVGTPVVALFFGPALPFDTAPYAEGHLCLHAEVACAPCDHNVTCLEPFCRDVLAPPAVAEAVMARRAGDWSRLAALAAAWPQIGWYRTVFDADGFLDVERLGRPRARGERLRAAYRALWKQVLAGGGAGGAARPPLRAEAACVRELAALAERAAARARAVEALAADGDLPALEAAARAVEELDAALFRFGAMHEPATLLVQVFRFEKENLEGDDVVALARATRAMHDELGRRARLLATLLDAEPRAPTAPHEEGEYARAS